MLLMAVLMELLFATRESIRSFPESSFFVTDFLIFPDLVVLVGVGAATLFDRFLFKQASAWVDVSSVLVVLADDRLTS